MRGQLHKSVPRCILDEAIPRNQRHYLAKLGLSELKRRNLIMFKPAAYLISSAGLLAAFSNTASQVFLGIGSCVMLAILIFHKKIDSDVDRDEINALVDGLIDDGLEAQANEIRYARD